MISALAASIWLLTATPDAAVARAAPAGDGLRLAADVAGWTHASAMLLHQLDHIVRHNTSMPLFWPMFAVPALQAGMLLLDAGPVLWIPFDLFVLLLDVTAHFGQTEIDPFAHLGHAWAEGHNAFGARAPAMGTVSQGILVASIASAVAHLGLSVAEGLRDGFVSRRRPQAASAGLAPAIGVGPGSIAATWRF